MKAMQLVILIYLLVIFIISLYAQEPIPTLWAGPTPPKLHTPWLDRDPMQFELKTTCHPIFKDRNNGRVLILVEDSLWAALTVYINRWAAELTVEGYTVLIETYLGGGESSLRLHLQDLYQEPDSLTGALFVGSIPYAIYEMYETWSTSPEYTDFISDIYYMDMTGTWTDEGAGGTTPDNGKYDAWIDAPKAIEIWVGRLWVENLPDTHTDVEYVSSYLMKNHTFRIGESKSNRDALVFNDDDWASMASQDSSNFEKIYDPEDVTVQYEDDAGNQCTAEIYKNNFLVGPYQWIYLRSHGYPMGHGFYQNYKTLFQYVYNSDYRSIQPDTQFYTLFVCSGCDWSYSSSNGYLGGCVVFETDAGLWAIGSTKTGGIWAEETFFDTLQSGGNLGNAFVSWFNYAHNAYPDYAPRWWYGMVMIGDPSLTPPNMNAGPCHPLTTGDVNCDGGINALDLAVLLHNLVDPENEILSCGDVNEDGLINTNDLVFLADYLSGNQ